MAKRKKNKGGLAAALICLFMAAATLLRGGRIDLPAVSDALGEVKMCIRDRSDDYRAGGGALYPAPAEQDYQI